MKSVSPSKLEAIVFDVGETIIDETSTWEAVADAAGVSRFTFMATIGGLMASGGSHRDVFEVFGVSMSRSRGRPCGPRICTPTLARA